MYDGNCWVGGQRVDRDVFLCLSFVGSFVLSSFVQSICNHLPGQAYRKKTSPCSFNLQIPSFFFFLERCVGMYLLINCANTSLLC